MQPSPPPLIVIEQPERYLHPSVLPIVAEHATDAARRTQVVFTTHSAAVPRRFSKNCADHDGRRVGQGETKLKTVSGESLDYWLREYTLGAVP